ncbi:MAG TPA: peptidoglycan-binding domain-containing protein [Pyrinomonadaceae bacterium]|nr:peptidoglycan-binding domain-containing protein [Pyrinomonadaceae bacterium]
MLTQGSRGNDVVNLQSSLNKAYPRDLPQLKPDGVFGPKTREWVVKFQRGNPPLSPDGVVGPKTLARLAAYAPSPGPGVPPPVGGITIPPAPPAAGIDRFRAEMLQEFEKKGKSNEFGAFLNDLESTTIPGWKIFLGTIGRVEDARQLASFWVELSQMLRGVEDQRRIVLAGIAKLNKNDLEIFEALAKPTGKLGKAVAFMGSVASIAGYLVTVIECVQHARRGDAGAVAAELYKFAMGKAVPWAAIIEGVGSLLDGVVPENTRKNSYVFKMLRSMDPIGLGGVAVDSLGSIVTAGAEMAARGRLDIDILTNRLTPLVARMKQGPANIFVELGENSGDALYELTQTDIDFQAMLRYSWMELGDWFKRAGSSGTPVGGVRRGTI